MIDLFEKCYVPALQDEIREKELYPYFHALESRQDVTVTMEGKRRIMLGSNNYLGLTVQPEVVEAGIAALRQYGTGCSGSRFLNGTLKLHLELEDALAEFLHQEAAMCFSPTWGLSAPLPGTTIIFSAIRKTTPVFTMAAGFPLPGAIIISTMTCRIWSVCWHPAAPRAAC